MLPYLISKNTPDGCRAYFEHCSKFEVSLSIYAQFSNLKNLAFG